MKKTSLVLAVSVSLLVLSGCRQSQENAIPVDNTSELPSVEESVPPVVVENQEVLTTARTGGVADQVIIDSPSEGALITSSLQVAGKAPGYWFFEALAPVEVRHNGQVIGQGNIEAQGEWKTEALVDFEGEIAFTLPQDTTDPKGWVVFKNANPSAMPENAAMLKVPVLFNTQ